jgi:hypothetical protein
MRERKRKRKRKREKERAKALPWRGLKDIPHKAKCAVNMKVRFSQLLFTTNSSLCKCPIRTPIRLEASREIETNSISSISSRFYI